MSIPLQALRNMTNAELLQRLSWDAAHGEPLRREMQRRMSTGQLILDQYDEDHTGNTNDDTILALLKQGTPGQIADYILKHSGWDGTDPANITSTQPKDALEFLESMRWRDYTWDELPVGSKTRGKWNAVIDSFGRWWRNR